MPIHDHSDDDLACSSCGLTMNQTVRLSNLPKVIERLEYVYKVANELPQLNFGGDDIRDLADDLLKLLKEEYVPTHLYK